MPTIVLRPRANGLADPTWRDVMNRNASQTSESPAMLLTLLAYDRPELFTHVSGVLSAVALRDASVSNGGVIQICAPQLDPFHIESTNGESAEATAAEESISASNFMSRITVQRLGWRNQAW